MREKILELLTNIHEAKELMEINDLLGFKTADELKELQDTINELVDEYIVFCTKKGKYILLENCPGLKIGRLSVNKKGFGFLVLEREDDIYIDDDNMNGAIHDDIVLAEIFTKGLRKEARILKVIKREFKNLVGEVFLPLTVNVKVLSFRALASSLVSGKILVKLIVSVPLFIDRYNEPVTIALRLPVFE